MDRYQPHDLNLSWQQDPEHVRLVRDHTIPDMARMAKYRYGRLQEQISRNDCAGALLGNSMNVRYATETRYASITSMHSPTRFVFVPNVSSWKVWWSSKTENVSCCRRFRLKRTC